MAESVADFLVERLTEWGISRMYGYPGDGINGISAALRRGGHGCLRHAFAELVEEYIPRH